MQFNRLTKALLLAPSSILLLVASITLTVVPLEHTRQATSVLLMTFLASCFFSFAGVASASNTMKVNPATRTARNMLLAGYGLLPFFLLGGSLLTGIIGTST